MVGQAIGFGLVFALVVFFVARKLCGPPGARHLARLNRIAGEEVNESSLSLYVRDWLPYVAGFLAMLVGGLFSFVSAGGLRRNFSSSDLPQLISGFQSGCQKRCLPERGANFCAGFCDCTLATLRANHPGDDAFAKWMQAGPQNLEALQAELTSAQNACLRALEPSSVATAQQPASVAKLSQTTTASTPPEPLQLDVPQYESAVLQHIREDFQPFLKWAAAAKLAPEKLAETEICAAPSEASFGICTKSVAAAGLGNDVYSISYKQGTPGAVRLLTTVQLLVDCQMLVPSRTLAQWRQGESEKQLCEISAGPLGGFQPLAVRSRLGTSLFAFTPQYLAHDAAFRATVTQRP